MFVKKKEEKKTFTNGPSHIKSQSVVSLNGNYATIGKKKLGK